MTNKPSLIDNRNGNTLVEALRYLAGKGQAGEVAEIAPPGEARIATAYFSPAGFRRIASTVAAIPSIKLLLGTEPLKSHELWQRQINEDEQRFLQRKLKEGLQQQDASLREERDHLPFSRESDQAVRLLIKTLRAGNMQVRRYEKQFLHAKTYIFTPQEGSEYNAEKAVIVGSSNLTSAGLTTNLELNMGRYDSETVEQACNWFDALWEDAVDFDLAAFFEEIFEYRTPFEIFLRVLWELYGDEIDKDEQRDQGLPLTSFQKHGVARALRLIEETGGALVADEVGLGKTFIAGEILGHYRDRRQRALLICPAALRDTSWKNFTQQYQIFLEVLSYEELAGEKQLRDAEKRPNATGNRLENIDEYQLVIIDEAHNYRNPDVPTRADALRALLYGKRKDVLMLTATPVNNSLWDLYNLTRFFVKQDSLFADKGILSIRERFDAAMKTNPNSLSPDVLYPIIDATTVKRTRQFIQKHYRNELIKRPDGTTETIVFPEPQAITVNYDLDNLMPGLFDMVEKYFDPDSTDCIDFVRYNTDAYLKVPGEEDAMSSAAVIGLLRSGLLKRFESSTRAFLISINRLVQQHEEFLLGLDKGRVLTTEFFKEGASTDDESFYELLRESKNTEDATLYDTEKLRPDIEKDLEKLREIQELLNRITPEQDPKLQALVQELVAIAKQADADKSSREDEIDMRKVVVFSFFSDTVGWIRDYLEEEIQKNSDLACYQGRVDMLVGRNGFTEGGDANYDKAKAAEHFAPKTMGQGEGTGETDILISTDVLAEGVNLQQARHIINYDLPWNPMRLVQRHGRIDRIGSQHSRVYLRTIFPTDRLDDLLHLEERIARKIAYAAASVGVESPVESVAGATRDFAETREEIEKLMQEDPSLYQRGGTATSAQSGEEYRQTLRKAMATRRDDILQMPRKAGSGMCKGREQGMFFCAKAGERTYLRFVHADENWQMKTVQDESADAAEAAGHKPMVDSEIGYCLRVIECDENEQQVMDGATKEAAYDLWEVARANIHANWMHETDPKNLQPYVRPLNRKVAEFIREDDNTPPDMGQEKISNALNILEAPWSRRDENRLREWFASEEHAGKDKARFLIEEVIESGLEPFKAPEPLPPIAEDDIELLVWLAIKPETS